MGIAANTPLQPGICPKAIQRGFSQRTKPTIPSFYRKMRQMKAEARPMVRVLRKRCGECGHLKSEHIKNSLCGDFYIEKVMLPRCMYCGRACEDEEDEMCQKCWKKRLKMTCTDCKHSFLTDRTTGCQHPLVVERTEAMWMIAANARRCDCLCGPYANWFSSKYTTKTQQTARKEKT